MTDFLEDVLTQAVAAALAHVERGGIPFVGVVVDGDRVISEFGVNRVHETGDPTAHAEIVAIRDALTASGRSHLRGATLLATGEPCGMCYRYALDAGITDIRVPSPATRSRHSASTTATAIQRSESPTRSVTPTCGRCELPVTPNPSAAS